MPTLEKTTGGQATEPLGTGLILNGDESHNGIISPATLGGSNTDNWNPTGLGTARVIRITPGGAINLTGIVAPSPLRGQLLRLVNLDTANTITLKHQVTSTAANQFIGPNSADVSLRKNAWVDVWYDVTTAAWRIVGP